MINTEMNFLENGYYSCVVCPIGRGNPRNSPDGVLALNDGTLLLPYSHKHGRMDEAKETAKGKTSRDGGRTWSRSFTIFAPDAVYHSGTAGWRRLQSGKLGIAFYRMNEYNDLKIYFRTSANEARTFSPETLITTEEGYNCPCDSRLVQLDSGRLLYPVAWVPKSRDENESYQAIVYYSDDQGQTWHRSRSALALPKRGAMEPVVAEIRDGRCMMLIRTQLGSQYQSFSDDGGDTWTPAEPSALVSPEAGGYLTRIPTTGHLVACWNYDYKPHWHKRHYGLRCPLSVAVSKDEGRTWENVKDIEDDHRYGYLNPTVDFINGHAYITYARAHLISQWAILDAKLTIVHESFFYNNQTLDRAFQEFPQPKSTLWQPEGKPNS